MFGFDFCLSIALPLLINDSPFHLLGTFPGPEGTRYEGGTFNVDIVIPDSYTFTPVKLKPSPNASGAVYLDILKDAWSPVLALKSTLISLQSLLCCPEPSDPRMPGRGAFDDTARYRTKVYAGGAAAAAASKSGTDEEKNVVQITEDGVVEELLK
ncbi:UBC-like protein [Hymenopellis radicata]|nr:UBC-like protein [Hymenopellis radicata]